MKAARLCCAVVWLYLVFAPGPTLASSLEEGIESRNEGWQLYHKAHSDDERREAIRKYEQALKVFQEHGAEKKIAAVLCDLGIVYFGRGEYEKAEDYFLRCQSSAHKANDLNAQANALNWLTEIYRIKGKYDKALDYACEALSMSMTAGSAAGEANARNNLGLLHWDRGLYSEAASYYQESLKVAKKMRDPAWTETRVLCNLGLVALDQGSYGEAADYYRRSLSVTNGQRFLDTEALTLNNLAIVYSDWGRYPQAADNCRRSMELANKLQLPRIEALALNHLGTIYRDWGQYALAIDCFQKALEINKKLGIRKAEAIARMDIGQALQRQEQYDKAIEQFRDALATYETLNLPANWPKELLAGLYMDMGDLAKAQQYVQDLDRGATTGRFCLMKGDYPKAEEHYRELLKQASKSNDAEDVFTSYTGLGVAYEAMGDYSRAAEFFGKAVEYTEELRTGLTPVQRERFFDVRINGFFRTVPYEGLARVLMRFDRPLEAWKASEYTKARVFSEAVARSSAKGGTGVPADLLKRDSELNDRLAALKNSRQKACEQDNRELAAVLDPQIEDAANALADHIKYLRKSHPLFAAMRYPEPMDLADTALRREEWVLAYDVTDTGVLIYLSQGKKLVAGLFKPVMRADLDELVRKCRKPLEVKDEESLSAHLASFDFASDEKLADILVSDVLASLPAGVPVVIVPDDSLGVLPFEMLLLNSEARVTCAGGVPRVEGAEFFGDRNRISYTQSVAAMTLTRIFAGSTEPPTRFLVVADTIFDQDEVASERAGGPGARNSTNHAYQELMAIRNETGLTFSRLSLTGSLGRFLYELDPGRTDLLAGTLATKDRLLVSPLALYKHMVFATHGYFGKDLPGVCEPVLVLTLNGKDNLKDGLLTMTEVMNLRIAADMVALTACQTGLGRRISGEGTMGMGRAFQYAGARSVLMSLWSVAEGPSVKLVEHFFKFLKRGSSALDSLTLARQELRKAGYDHPFFWAPFILMGEVD